MLSLVLHCIEGNISQFFHLKHFGTCTHDILKAHPWHSGFIFAGIPCTVAFVAQSFAFSSLSKLLYPWRLRTLCCLQLQTIDAAWFAIPAGFASFWTRMIELGWTPLLQIAAAISWLVLPKVSSCLPWSLLKTKDQQNNWVVPSTRQLRHEMFFSCTAVGPSNSFLMRVCLQGSQKWSVFPFPLATSLKTLGKENWRLKKSRDTTKSDLETLECWWNSKWCGFFLGSSFTHSWWN